MTPRRRGGSKLLVPLQQLITNRQETFGNSQPQSTLGTSWLIWLLFLLHLRNPLPRLYTRITLTLELLHLWTHWPEHSNIRSQSLTLLYPSLPFYLSSPPGSQGLSSFFPQFIIFLYCIFLLYYSKIYFSFLYFDVHFSSYIIIQHFNLYKILFAFSIRS